MTTEILRNLLFNKKIRDIQNRVEIEIDIHQDFSLIVFDEIHYINDKDRGKVWEESIILYSTPIQIMMLSAAIDNPWNSVIGFVKLKIEILYCHPYKRVVPLRHSVYTHYLESYMKKTKEFANCSKYNNQLSIFSDENTPFNADTYQNVFHHLKRTYNGLSRTHVYRELIDYLTSHNMTPCIFFFASP